RMSEQKNSDIRSSERVNTMRDDFERVDIEPAVGFIENRVSRLDHGELENLATLFLATGKPFVDRARRKRAIHPEQFHFFVKLCVIFGGFEVFTLRQTGLHRRAQKVRNRHPWDFAGILESEEQAFAGTLIRFEAKNTLAIH